MKRADPKHSKEINHYDHEPPGSRVELVHNKVAGVPVLHLLMSVTRQRQVFIKTAVWRMSRRMIDYGRVSAGKVDNDFKKKSLLSGH